eukprot:m.78698 g.78698  ORF g.78698 m.78698 type:complete len:485 (-) comp25142_c0_seq1:80-1534(-)
MLHKYAKGTVVLLVCVVIGLIFTLYSNQIVSSNVRVLLNIVTHTGHDAGISATIPHVHPKNLESVAGHIIQAIQQRNRSLGSLTAVTDQSENKLKNVEGDMRGVHVNASNIVCQSFWHQHYASGDACLLAAIDSRQRLRHENLVALVDALKLGSLPTKRDARAIVFTTNSPDSLEFIATHITYMRSRWEDCHTIAVEVHSEDAQVVSECLKLAKDVAIECVTTSAMLKGIVEASAHERSHFAFKPLALLQSRYRHVLFLDVDTVPLASPTTLFESDEYKTHGSIFWPDIWGLHCRQYMWGDETALCGQMGWPEHILWATLGIVWQPLPHYAQEQDSGQLCVDTVHHMKLLVYTLMLASDEFVQNTVYGDKDCFRLAWLAHATMFAYGPFPQQVGQFENVDDHHSSFNREYILHDWHGAPMFLHQWKSANDDRRFLRQTAIEGTNISVSPECYDGCVESQTKPLDNSVNTSLELWMLSRHIHPQR